jgi:hypothetical protein
VSDGTSSRTVLRTSFVKLLRSQQEAGGGRGGRGGARPGKTATQRFRSSSFKTSHTLLTVPIRPELGHHDAPVLGRLLATDEQTREVIKAVPRAHNRSSFPPPRVPRVWGRSSLLVTDRVARGFHGCGTAERNARKRRVTCRQRFRYGSRATNSSSTFSFLFLIFLSSAQVGFFFLVNFFFPHPPHPRSHLPTYPPTYLPTFP